MISRYHATIMSGREEAWPRPEGPALGLARQPRRVLRDRRTSKVSKTAAASALSQRAPRRKK